PVDYPAGQHARRAAPGEQLRPPFPLANIAELQRESSEALRERDAVDHAIHDDRIIATIERSPADQRRMPCTGLIGRDAEQRGQEPLLLRRPALHVDDAQVDLADGGAAL